MLSEALGFPRGARDIQAGLEASAEVVVLTDGFCWRTQLGQLGGRDGTHLAELLDPR